MAPIFSVVVPSYNRRNYLRPTLASTLAQKFEDGGYEVIVVDDGSTDSTDAMVAELQRGYGRLRYVRQENAGPAAARNRGIAVASGEFIAFTDSDCEVPPDWLRRLVRLFEQFPEAVGVGGIQVPINSESSVTRFLARRSEVLYGIPVDRPVAGAEGHGTKIINWENRHEAAPVTNNVAYRASVLRSRGGFSEAFRGAAGEDADLNWRLLAAGHTLVLDPTLAVTHHDISTVRQLWRRAMARGTALFPTWARRGQLDRKAALRVLCMHAWRILLYCIAPLWPICAVRLMLLWARQGSCFSGLGHLDRVRYRLYLGVWDLAESLGILKGALSYTRWMKTAQHESD